jgi:ABC-type multidrug transport system fused ATPase/permease subunit
LKANSLEVQYRVVHDDTRADTQKRIQSYVAAEKEPHSTEEGKPPAYWPASGDLRVENLSARYSVNGPKVLENVSFHIRSGERIGVGAWVLHTKIIQFFDR